MKKLLALCTALTMMFSVVGCNTNTTTQNETNTNKAETATTVTVTDMAGRTVEIKSEINKVYCAEPVSAIALYTLEPELLLGWNYKLNDYEKEFILPEYQNLPIYGMNDSVNIEAIINDSPDVCIQMGSSKESDIEKADKLSEQLGIPVLIISNSLHDSAEMYRFMGTVLGQEEKAEALAKYCEDVLTSAKELTPSNPPTIYYGNGEDSLETAPAGSVSAEVFEILGADNVAKVELDGGSRVQVSSEQILSWDPEYIFVNGEPKKSITGSQAKDSILENPAYASLQAVQNNKVYSIPKSPFAWVDRPMGPNRIIGIEWVKSVLYPDLTTKSQNEIIKEFYNLFYHMELTDTQIERLLSM